MRRWMLTVLLGGTVACEDTDPMASQPRAEAFEASTFFDDGRAMRPLVPGTVAREWRDRGATQGLTADGGWVQAVPVPLTRALLEEGRTAYETWCAVCHGLTGDGDAIVARKMPLRRPPGLFVPHDHATQVVYGVAEGEAPYTGTQAVTARVGPGAFPLPARVDGWGAVRDTADAGRPGTPGQGLAVSDADAARARQHALIGPRGLAMEGRLDAPAATGDLPHPPGFYFAVISQGFGVMPAYGPQLTPQERWAVVAYLRALGRSQRTPITAAPPEVQARLRQEVGAP
ncbi:cytochrome c [Corallococcus macrosporus]|uniref:Cytochrome c n=1 Tax=Corallococcus macrosporus TaxID=35 RepID=A0ABS3DFZ5_9BACT|nr:cytochrome c [Corallococcus macrosporus]MBN8230240.1 cytochrome c [Corallococcus macrosporus]